MNQDHATGAATGAVGSVTIMGALTGTIAHFQGVDANVAANEAALLLFGAGAMVGLIAWFIAWKYPGAPPLPHLLDNPDEAPPPAAQ